MPADSWQFTLIGELLARDGGSVKTGPFGTTLKASEYSKDGVPLISVREVGLGSLRVDASTPRVPAEVIERLPEYVLRSGDIVFGRKGAVDRSAMVKPDQDGWFLGSDGIRLRLPRTCDPRYIAYQLQGPRVRSWLLQHATGTTMASLNQSTVERIPIAVPPIDEQRAIADSLESLDNKIELNRRTSQTLDGIARAIFKSWFVDFDPVRAKMNGRVPSGLSTEMADLFPDALSESELGSIPMGWRVRSLGEWVDPVRGRSYKSVELQDSRTALVTLKSFHRGGGYRADGLKAYAGPYKPEQVVTPGEVAVACTDVTQAAEVIGRPAIVEPDPRFDVLVASLDVLIARMRNSRVGRPFVYLLLGSEGFASHAYAHTSGTTVLHLDRRCLPEFGFAAPPDYVLAAFNRIAEPMFASIAENKAVMRTLGDLRNTLLPRLISGEVRTKDAEQLLDAANQR
jgi:type I restriction enzyme S subunit